MKASYLLPFKSAFTWVSGLNKYLTEWRMEAGQGSYRLIIKPLFFRLQASFSLPNFYYWPNPGPSFMVYVEFWDMNFSFFPPLILGPSFGLSDQLRMRGTFKLVSLKKRFTISFFCNSLSTLAQKIIMYLGRPQRHRDVLASSKNHPMGS